MKKISFSSGTRIFILTLLLLTFGLIMIYSASVSEGLRDFGTKWYFVLLQLKWAGAGIVGMLLVGRLPVKLIEKAAPNLLIFGLILLVAVLIPGVGTKLMGARRWLALPGFTLQPSELMKAIEVIYLSSWLTKRQATFPQFLAFIGILGGLIMLQPDMGTTIVVVGIAFSMYFLTGYPLRHLFALLVIGIVVGGILILIEPYRLARVTTFFNPELDPQGSSYHIRQVVLALGSGGVSGVGIGRSRQKYQYLPESTTDSIFAVVGEELGFIGGLTMVGGFVYYVYLMMVVARKSRSRFCSALAGGICAWIGIQVLLNLAAMVALAPLTGIPLPLVSYGGSALITTLGGIGLVLAVARDERV